MTTEQHDRDPLDAIRVGNVIYYGYAANKGGVVHSGRVADHHQFLIEGSKLTVVHSGRVADHHQFLIEGSKLTVPPAWIIGIEP